MPDEVFQPSGYARGLRRVFLVVLAGLLCLVGYVQTTSTKRLSQRSVREQTRLVYVPARRGMLQDREGRPLNVTMPSYSIVLRPELVRDPRDTRRRTLEKISAELTSLGLSLGTEYYQYLPSQEQLERHLRNQPALPIMVWEDVDSDTLARWTLLRHEHPATELLLTWRREYLEPEFAPQLRGLVKRAAPRVNGMERFWNANAPNLAGASGLEKALEPALAGVGGSERLQTDVLSYRSKVLEAIDALPGENCRMSLCRNAQLIAYKHFISNSLRGAAVALDLRTGEVLVSLSMPQQPLGVHGAGADGAYQNRVLSGFYPPGSTLKPLLALYALEHQLITPFSPVVACPGYYELPGQRRLACSHVHGEVAVVPAIAQSCNVFFSTLSAGMSDEALDDFARFFGFGERTGGILSSEESSGIAFSPGWVAEHRSGDRAWHTGDAANAGIGQGGWVVTPMQMALAMGFALTGKLFSPQFLRGEEAVVRRTHDWTPVAQRTVLAGMRQCVLQGTGRSLDTPELSILGKTGTAEVGKHQRPHAWMVAAAPAEEPRFVVVVVVEHGGGGGRVAGPIARDILLSLARELD